MTHSFQIDGSRTFVAGLFWHPLSGVASDNRKEIAKLADELGFAFAAQPNIAIAQVGLAAKQDDAEAGWISAAGVIAATVDAETGIRDFLCATAIGDDLWLYVAQRDGVILPDGDMVGSAAEIQARMLQDLSLGTWALIYAPAAWQIHNAAEERSFEDFLPLRNGKPDYKAMTALKPVKGLHVSLGGMSLKWPLILLTLAMAGYYAYDQWQTSQQEALLAEQAAAKVPQKLPHPWKTIPRAKAFAAACAEAFPQLGTLWPGNWKPKDLTCSGSQLSIVWNRTEHGWIEHLHKIQPKAMIIGDGSIATLSAPLKLPPGEDEAAPREDVRTVAMYAAAQKYGFKLQLTPVPPPPPPPQEGGEPPPMPDWREIKWSVQATELPYFVVIGALESEGFRISQLKKVFTEGKSTWTLEGTQYVQL